jgi:hypothetical protein
VEVQRLTSYDNTLGFYSVDSITGNVKGLNPGDTGYLQAALARSREEGLLLDARTLPAFGASATFNSLPLNTRERYGMLLLQNGFCSYPLNSRTLMRRKPLLTKPWLSMGDWMR